MFTKGTGEPPVSDVRMQKILQSLELLPSPHHSEGSILSLSNTLLFQAASVHSAQSEDFSTQRPREECLERYNIASTAVIIYPRSPAGLCKEGEEMHKSYSIKSKGTAECTFNFPVIKCHHIQRCTTPLWGNEASPLARWELGTQKDKAYI